MATIDDRERKLNELHARITEARVAIRKAVATNSHAPCLAGSQQTFALLTEADRLLNNAVATLPWQPQTTT